MDNEIADRVSIEALRGEFVDAAMTRDYERLASLFTEDGAIRIPHIGAVGIGHEQIKAGAQRMGAVWDCFVQATHAGVIQLGGEVASGRAYISELMNGRSQGSFVNHGIYHDRYRRTAEGWKFTERTYEIIYLDTSHLAGGPPTPTGHGATEASA